MNLRRIIKIYTIFMLEKTFAEGLNQDYEVSVFGQYTVAVRHLGWEFSLDFQPRIFPFRNNFLELFELSDPSATLAQTASFRYSEKDIAPLIQILNSITNEEDNIGQKIIDYFSKSNMEP